MFRCFEDSFFSDKCMYTQICGKVLQNILPTAECRFLVGCIMKKTEDDNETHAFPNCFVPLFILISSLSGLRRAQSWLVVEYLTLKHFHGNSGRRVNVLVFIGLS